MSLHSFRSALFKSFGTIITTYRRMCFFLNITIFFIIFYFSNYCPMFPNSSLSFYHNKVCKIFLKSLEKKLKKKIEKKIMQYVNYKIYCETESCDRCIKFVRFD